MDNSKADEGRVLRVAFFHADPLVKSDRLPYNYKQVRGSRLKIDLLPTVVQNLKTQHVISIRWHFGNNLLRVDSSILPFKETFSPPYGVPLASSSLSPLCASFVLFCFVSCSQSLLVSFSSDKVDTAVLLKNCVHIFCFLLFSFLECIHRWGCCYMCFLLAWYLYVCIFVASSTDRAPIL